jgi:single-stranded-DNA-specific exonuclease
MENSARPGLKALIDAASAKKSGDDGKKKKINSSFIGFGIAPRINAAGRISDAAIAVKALLANEEEAPALAEELCEINRQRQIEENRIAEEANRKIEEEGYLNTDRFLVLADDHWQQGIIGIVASRLTERHGIPSILISFDGADANNPRGDDVGKGSGRSVKGINLVEAMDCCEDLLCKFGGHELAAGMTILRKDVDAFRKRINRYVRERIPEE